ncbi:MAG: group 1 truncated hemoglobin [Candidatus Cloacimonadota bacterium]|nr:MAG: group 1 truncated hemoglobin [Candidatus Cloacimonadota bacterium]
MAESLYDKIGGRKTLEKVHKVFYTRLLKHEWLKLFFRGINQTILENQQSDFICEAMGGPKCYSGKFPIPTHKHMLITDEQFMIRHKILEESILFCGVSKELSLAWLKIDKAFQAGICKKSIDECEKRYATDKLLAFPKP